MITINILADAKYPVERVQLRKHLEKILEKYKLVKEVELSISIVGKRKMSEYHRLYMQIAGPTDVLSFPLNDPGDERPFVASPDGILRLGDIVVCYPVAVDEALEKQCKVDTQIQFLAEHGLMHLLGFHHE
ncbi:MAG: rRNA maturation RNase YbeY [bacterium]